MNTIYCTALIIILLNLILSISLVGIINLIYKNNISFHSYGFRLFITYEKKVKGDWGTIETRVFTKELNIKNLFKGFK